MIGITGLIFLLAIFGMVARNRRKDMAAYHLATTGEVLKRPDGTPFIQPWRSEHPSAFGCGLLMLACIGVFIVYVVLASNP